MMNGPEGILLLVCTGAHAGAEPRLTGGVWVVGADDSCDLIFQDSGMTARHCTLTVEDDGPGLIFAPLDGECRLDGAVFPAGPLPPGTMFYLGNTGLLWIAAREAGADRWEEAMRALREPGAAGRDDEVLPDGSGPDLSGPEASGSAASGSAASGSAASGSDDSDPDASGAAALEPAAGGANENGGGATIVAVRPAKRSGTWKLLGLFFVALALCGLTISFNSKGARHYQDAEKLNALLHREGFTRLEARALRQGLVVRGELESDEARSRLLELVRKLHYPAYIDVRVRNDRTSAVQEAFNVRGLYPEVRESLVGEEGVLEISAYMQDSAVEDWAFTGMHRDVPPEFLATAGRKPLRLTRNILHADGLEALLVPALRQADLAFAAVAYLPGKVAITGSFTEDQRRKLHAALAEVQKKAGVPVPMEISASPPPLVAVTQPAPARGNAMAAPRLAAQTPEGFSVTGVVMEPMRFLTLSTGERVFEGGVLPGDWVVEKITLDNLHLRRGAQPFTYELRGGS